MERRKKIAINPYFNQFIYDIVYNASREDRRSLLDRKYLVACRSPRNLRHFITKASMEEKDEMLVQLGVEWVKVYFDTGYPQKRYLRSIFEEYDIEKGGSPSLISTLIKNRVFVTGDKQFAALLGAMAQLQNHSIYSQSLLLSKAGYHLEKWKKESKDSDSIMANENIKKADQLVATFFSVMQSYECVEGLLGIHKNDIRILFYLYGRRNKYTPFDTIFGKFIGEMRKEKITTTIRRLHQSQMIAKSAKKEERQYLITASGIMLVNTFFQNILKANTFQ